MTYYKIVNDRYQFTTGKSIRLESDHAPLVAGQVVSNPSAELLAAEGWEVYVPPVVPASPQTEPGYNEILQAVKRMLSTETEELSDEDALDVAALFPTWASKMGEAVAVGERLWYDGKLYKVLQAHTVQSNWTPDTAVSLYVEVSIEEWPEFVQPTGAQDAYMQGDKVTFENQHYISLIDNNVYSPAAYPAGWQLQS